MTQQGTKRKFSMEVSISELPTERQADVCSAMRQINAEMHARGVEVRDDSALTFMLATCCHDESERSKYTQAVCDEVVRTQRTYAHTRLAREQESLLRECANYLHQQFPNVPWRVIWSHVRTHINPLLKIYFLRADGNCEAQLLQ